jgi:predicted ATPase
MGPGAADIAEIVPEIHRKLTDLATPQSLEPEQARFRLFDSITTFLKSASQGQPLILVLDDLQWADKPSLLLLEFLARELAETHLLVIGTYRDIELPRRHPLADTLGELNRERLFQRILLRGLNQQDVGRIIENTSNVPPPAWLIEAVHTQTEGNPLFVMEVVRLLAQEGELTGENAITQESWTVRIPEGVREVIGRRLNRLSQRCNETLAVASVIGREFELRQLAPVIGDMSEDLLLDLLEEALAARVVEELPQAVSRYQFTHSLIQETLATELSLTRRVRLHARIAETLEDLYGDDAEAHASELAYHFSEAASSNEPEKLAKYSTLAEEQALAVYAYEEAQSCYQQGLVALGVPLTVTEPAKNSQEAALLAGLGRAELAILPRFQLSLAVALLRRAADYYVRNGDVAGAVAVAEQPIPTMGLSTGMTQLIAHVLSHVAPGSHAAGRTLCNYGMVLGLDEVDYRGAQEAFRQALDIAQRERDSILEARAQQGTFEVDIFHLRFRQAVEKGRRAIELSRNAGDLFAEARGLMWTCRVMLLSGDLEEARQHL